MKQYKYIISIITIIILSCIFLSCETNLKDESAFYAVTFDSDGGTGVSPQEIEKGKCVLPPTDPIKENYVFKGWFYNNTQYDFSKPVSSNIVLKAKWKGIDIFYTVKHLQQNFENNNYTEIVNDREQIKGNFHEYTSATSKKYNGFTPKSFSQKLLDINTDIVIEIYYDRNHYNVTIDTNNGDEEINYTIKYGEKISVPEEPTKDPFDFKGWYIYYKSSDTYSDDVFDFDTTISSSTYLKALWTFDLSKEKNGNFIIKNDEFKGVHFINHNYFSNLSSSDIPIKIYIGVQEKNTYLRLLFKYYGSTWIFFTTSIIINDEGDKLTWSFKSYDKKTEVVSTSVQESIDVSLSEPNIAKLLDLLKGENVRLRLYGEQYYKEYSLNKDYTNALIEIINMYKDL